LEVKTMIVQLKNQLISINKNLKNVLNFKILFPRIIFEFLIKKNNDVYK
jgi:hypothetical protein